MGFKKTRAELAIKPKDKAVLDKIAKSRTEQKTRIERAKFMLYYSQGKSINSIARELNTNRPKIERCIDKALAFGVITALNDLPRRGRSQTINRDARAWFLSIACQKPKDLGLASEFWTNSTLSNYIRINCKKAGHPSLSKIGRGTVSKILNKSDIKPHKMSYYLVKKDPEHETKMAQVLHFYKEIEIAKHSETNQMVAYLSYDEKPGIQAIKNIAEDLSPKLSKYSTWTRDYEYKRLGTVSLLASIDLINGKVYGKVFERHRSKEFVEFLKHIDKIYPEEFTIKTVLDNHSSHISKETRAYLKTKPGRFEFIFTPTHASWLNLVESFFSKFTKSFLKGIRVNSKEELIDRILQYLQEINNTPTIYKWKWRMDEIIIN